MDGKNLGIKGKEIAVDGDNCSQEEQIILNIDDKCVFKTKIDNIDKLNNSLFKDVYHKAIECLVQIISYNEQIEEGYFENYDYNNIVAFLGKNGSGKTSSMKSFRNSLDTEVLPDIEIKEYKKIKNNSFELLNIIDARCTLGEKSILEIIVYSLYKKFKEKDIHGNISEVIELENEFNQIFSNISRIKGDVYKENDELKLLMELSSVVTIKENLTKLIKKYLSYMSCSKENNNFLVISIDNLDISLTSFNSHLEEIRKYFFIHNVIILITVNFRKEINNKIDTILEDIIPFNRRIYMPNLKSVENLKLKIDSNYFGNIPISNDESFYQSIINIFYIKLNYIISTRKHYNAIVPSNLSKFIELIVFLNSIKDDYTYKKKIEIISMYYEKEIIKEITEDSNKLFLKKLLKCDINKINGDALLYINSLIYERNKHQYVSEESWNDVLYVKEKKLLVDAARVTLGDIVTWIKKFELLIENEEERKFIEVFKSIYTIRLLEIFYTKPTLLLNITGFNFIGNYFNVVLNKYKDKFSKVIAVDEEYSLGEFRNCFKCMNNDLLSVLLHPRFNSNSTYARLIRSENKDYITSEDLTKFNNYEFNYFNIISYSLYKNQLKSKFDEESIIEEEFLTRNQYTSDMELEYHLLLIINIDTWMKILEILDIKYKNQVKTKRDFLIDSINLVNDIFDKYNYKYKFNNYRKLIEDEPIEMICQLNEVFEKVCYLHENKY